MRIVPLLVCALLCLSSEPTHAAHHWAITDFEVYLGKPYKYNDPWYRAQLATGLDPDTEIELCQDYNQRTCDNAVAVLQSYLHDVAIELQNMGFADPTADGMESVITDYNGRKKIRVYLFDFLTNDTEDKIAFFTNPCDRVYTESFLGKYDLGLDMRRVLLLDSRDMFRGGVVSDVAFSSAAHEMFHAVQFASQMRKGASGCKVSKWITEGTADAMGFYLAKKLRNASTREWDKVINGNPVFGKPWGMRGYYVPLSSKFPRSTADYQTMSFWRHLAEWDHAKGQGKDHPGSAKATEQYHYLVDLFSRSYGTPGTKNDLQWLESWMKSYTTMGGGLAPVFAQFTASLADHMSTRIPTIENLAPSDRESKWLKALFEPCTEITLSRQQPWQPVQLDIDMVSARCVTVNIQSGTPQPVSLVIDNSDLGEDKQKQVRVGAMGGQLVAIPDIRISQLPAKDAGTSYALYEFLALAGDKNTYVFSNTGKNAKDTDKVIGTFNFALPSWGSNMTRTTPAPPPSRSAEPPAQPKTRKAVQQHNKSKRSNPTTNSLAAVMAGADNKPPAPSCTGELQSKNLCGPKLTIALTLDYGFTPGMGPTAASGGMLKQMGSLNETGTGDEQVMATLVQTMANNKRGSLVSLSIPVVDYGYSGTVSNAVLEVPGEDKDTFTAVHTAPDENGMYTPNGTVTITEYSPHMLRGTFSGSLVKVEDMHKASSENPVLPVSETISGQFAVAAPWRGNAAPSAVDADSALMTGAREDMMDLLLKIPEDMRSSMITGEQVQKLCQLGFEDQQLANLGISGGCTGSGAGSASVQQCDCSCEAWVPMKEIPLCQSQCSTHWETEQCEVSIAEENRQRDEEYERYRSELLALNLDEDTADTQLHAFRNAPQGLREKLWNDLEIIRQELAQMGASDVQQAKEMNKPVQNWDAETLSYKAALEAAGKSEVEINGLATLFSISDETVRQVLWDDLQQ